jgi:hypothetical protein
MRRFFRLIDGSILMKIQYALQLATFALFAAACPLARCGDAPDIQMTVEFHMEGSKNPAPPYTLDNHDPGAYFLVALKNISSKPLLLDDDIIDYLYFQVTDEHGKTTKVSRTIPDRSATRPPWPLAPGETYMVKIHYVYLNKGGFSYAMWNYQFEFPPPGKSVEVTLRAVIDSEPDKMAAGLKEMEKAPSYTPEMLQKLRDQNAAILKSYEKQGLWVSGGQSEEYKVTLTGSKQADKP